MAAKPDTLQVLIDSHRFHARSELVLGRKLHKQFPDLCPWRLDLFQRGFVEQLRRRETSPAAMESLTWSREQRKARRQLCKTVPRRRRSELMTALEVWSVSCAAAAALEIKSARYFADNLSLQG